MTRRGGLMYLISLRPPYNGKLLRGLEAGRGFDRVSPAFSWNDQLAYAGNRFWRTGLEAELLWPVSVG